MSDETGTVVPINPRVQATRTPAHMAAMRARRAELMAAGDKKARGGRRRIRLDEDEIQERATQTVVDVLVGARVKALAELERLLESKDSGDRKFAVKTILEYTEGKPKQVIETPEGGPAVIVYRTAALPEPFRPFALEDAADSG